MILLDGTSKKSIFLVSIFVALIVLGLSLPSVDAAHPPGKDTVKIDLSSGTNTISFRDAFNNKPQSSSVSAIQDSFPDFTITVTDADANLDPNAIDVILSSASSTTSGASIATTELTETGFNTGIFQGKIFVRSTPTIGNELQVSNGDAILLIYEPEPQSVGRFFSILSGVTGASNVILKDGVIGASTEQFSSTCPFDLYIHPVSMTFSDATATGVTATLSYANADLGTESPLDLKMVYRPTEGSGFVSLSTNTAAHDTTAKTITNQIQPPDIVLPPPTGAIPKGQGDYSLAIDRGGCVGGGGGGLTKPGLIVNALGFTRLSTGVGGGGGGNSPPSFGQSSFAIISGGEEGFGGIINDNDANTLEETKTFKVGEKAILRFDFTEGGGIGKIEHIKLFTNVRDGQKRQDSDASISYDPLKSPPVTVHDPNGLFTEAHFELLQMDVTKFVLKYDLTFAKPMAKSDLILESWNIKKWSSINKIPNAIEVISSGIISEEESEPVKTFLNDVTDDQVIPVWIKSNAKWWSDDEIDNENFISGLEYLVNEGIISVSFTEGTDNSISEMPSWIKSTAGWWADGMISEDEFITAIEWMISNNIIQVAA